MNTQTKQATKTENIEQKLRAEQRQLVETRDADGERRQQKSEAVTLADAETLKFRTKINNLLAESSQVKIDIEQIDRPAALHLVNNPGLDLGKFAKRQSLRERLELLSHVMEIIRSHLLPDREDEALMARAEHEEAIANHLDSECRIREFNLTSLLAAATEYEAVIEVSSDGTITAELKREAANHRLIAMGLREQVLESQRKRAMTR